jgi:putative redox protein
MNGTRNGAARAERNTEKGVGTRKDGTRRKQTKILISLFHFSFPPLFPFFLFPFPLFSCSLSPLFLSPFFLFPLSMKVELVRVDDGFHFEATGSASDVKVHTDAAPNIGGQNAGVRPMELLLMGLASCSAIDVVLVLKKQRQEILDFRISVEGDREKEEGTERSPFRKIHLHYFLKGNIDPAKAERAVKMSMEKYCSATAQMEALAEITHEITIEA